MLIARLAPIAATDSEIAAHVASVRRSFGWARFGISAGVVMVPISLAAVAQP
jgi:hypothetical protein